MTKINGDLYIGETGVQLKNIEVLAANNLTFWQGLLGRKYLDNTNNLDNIKTAGMYGCYGDTGNLPTGGAISVVEVIVYSPDWLLQRVTSIAATPHMWERTFTSGTTWNAWVQRW